MPRPLSWQRLETAIEHCARAEGWPLDRTAESGDLIADGWLNLTQFAKNLAEELAP